MPAFLFLVLLFSGAGQSAPQPPAVSAGLQALDKQDYRSAEEIFSKLSAANPQDYSALFYLALADTGLNKDSEAVAAYKHVLALKPELYEAQLNLGIVLLRDHDASAALPYLQSAARQKPNQPRPQRYLGDALLQSGDFTGAAAAYGAALGQDPKMAPAELGLGQAILQEGKLDEALPHYQQAAALDPALKSYLLEIAGALSKANRGDAAIPLLRQFPQDAGACEELGRIYLSQHQPADAVPAFESAVKISPTPANRLALATAYLQNNQPDAAAPILQQALASDPRDYDLRMAVGRIYRDKRQFLPAANEFVAAGEIKPDSAEAWNEAASVFVMAQQYPQALAALDKVRALNAEKPGDFYYRALVYDKLRQIKLALENYQHFLSVSKGQFPDQEFIARQRSRILEKEANR
ncbi:MAG: tetratricopeptide repeat protein [Acidobacteriaceae bacterium]|nr:tetratricopeptide repeat protein [Acidobacteriaceae bacterium]